MLSKSFRYNKDYIINKEKRFRKRVLHSQSIYYPIINGKSIAAEIDDTGKPIMETVDITEYGLGLRSRVPLKVGDFLNLSLKLPTSPTFECICVVKWAGVDDISYTAGCEFCHIRNNDRQYVREYMNLHDDTK